MVVQNFQVSLADAEEKYELVIESFAQLQCDMMFQVNTLQVSVQQLQKALRETGRKCGEVTKVRAALSSFLNNHDKEVNNLKTCHICTA